MKVFTCPGCGQLVFFANTACLRCGTMLAIDPAALTMVDVGDGGIRCANHAVLQCNWLTEPGQPLCLSCRLTRTRPADGDTTWLERLGVAEGAKRRLVFQLLTIGLPLRSRDETTGSGVAFDLLSSAEVPVTTGHAGGVITLDLAETDDLHRERVRTKLSEPYRTVLGHFRHEIGHYYFPVLVNGGDLVAARGLFGDESMDYQAALDRHYAQGPPAGWVDDYISEYATMHPAEDWAETFAHYLHLRGVLQTAASYRLRVEGPSLDGWSGAPLASDPATVDVDDIDAMLTAWLPLSYALNAVTRSMGADDLYPFVLSATVMDKLRFVHRMVVAGRTTGPAALASG